MTCRSLSYAQQETIKLPYITVHQTLCFRFVQAKFIFRETRFHRSNNLPSNSNVLKAQVATGAPPLVASAHVLLSCNSKKKTATTRKEREWEHHRKSATQHQAFFVCATTTTIHFASLLFRFHRDWRREAGLLLLLPVYSVESLNSKQSEP